MTEKATIGQRLKELRDERGYTQAEIAQIAGVERKTIMRLESTANCDTKLSVAIVLADFFDVSVDYLVGRTPARTANVTVVTVEVERPERRFFNPEWEERRR